MIVSKLPPIPDCICSLPSLPSVNKKSKQIVDRWHLHRAWLDLVDEVACIHLNDRADRLPEAIKQFHENGLCCLVQLHGFDRPSDVTMFKHGIKMKGKYGCWSSHRSVMEEAWKRKARRILVLEDDFLFRKPMTLKRLQRLDSQLSTLDSWEMFLLGHIPLPFRCYPTPTWSSFGFLWRTKSYLTHAYIMNAKGMKHFVEEGDYCRYAVERGGKEADVDYYFSQRFQQHACFPQLIVQSGSKSSITAWEINWLGLYGRYVGSMEIAIYFVVPIVTLLLVGYAGYRLLRPN